MASERRPHAARAAGTAARWTASQHRHGPAHRVLRRRTTDRPRVVSQGLSLLSHSDLSNDQGGIDRDIPGTQIERRTDLCGKCIHVLSAPLGLIEALLDGVPRATMNGRRYSFRRCIVRGNRATDLRAVALGNDRQSDLRRRAGAAGKVRNLLSTDVASRPSFQPSPRRSCEPMSRCDICAARK